MLGWRSFVSLYWFSVVRQTLHFNFLFSLLQTDVCATLTVNVWLQLKDNSAILFVVSLDDFHVFDEDGNNQLLKSRKVFKDLCKSIDLYEIPVVIIFNKVDFFGIGNEVVALRQT